MRSQIDVLREVFIEWLQMHGLDYDFWIHTGGEWAEWEGGHNLFNGAELVLMFDNQLSSILTVTGPFEIGDELQELAAGFGYYYELGNHTSLGFYPAEGESTTFAGHTIF